MSDQIEVEAETHRAEMRARIKAAQKRHDRAAELLEFYLDVVEEMCLRLLDGADIALTDQMGLVRKMGESRLFASKEAAKYEESVLENTGLVADAPLDLDAIRLEIGSRLDRLRATR